MTSNQASAELWRPGAARIAGARLTEFADRHLPGADYRRLHAWSLASPEEFWSAVWDHFGLLGDKGATVFRPGDHLWDSAYLPDATLNYAENLLRGPDERIAIVHVGEDGRRREVPMGELRATVAALAHGLAEEGVGPGDRVAGVVPNTPEALAAMLATLARGAVWSSCSPDFGPAAVLDRLGQVEPAVVFASSGYSYGGKVFDTRGNLAQVVDRLPSVRRCVVYPYHVEEAAVAGLDTAVAWDDFVSGRESTGLAFEPMPASAPGFILFSSGTTGRPKCIVHSAAGLLLKHVCELGLHCDVKANDTLQFFTTCGWMMWNWMASALAVEATVVTYDGSPMHPEPERLAAIAWQEGATHFGASAKYFSACEKAGVDPLGLYEAAGPRTILSTGSPLLPASFDYLYRSWGDDLHVASISGGTDICACFVGGVPTLPVRRGEIQAAELGCDVAAYNAQGQAVVGEAGELVCRSFIPSMPLGFLNDDDRSRFKAAYFDKHPGVWSHGDWITMTADGSLTISGRSDATLNPGGVRIGTAEIYRQVEVFAEVAEALAVGQAVADDERVVLFVRLAAGCELDDDLSARIRAAIRSGASPRHVPAAIYAVADIPRTRSGKIAELAVKNVVNGQEVVNADALANPEALELYRGIADRPG